MMLEVYIDAVADTSEGIKEAMREMGLDPELAFCLIDGEAYALDDIFKILYN